MRAIESFSKIYLCREFIDFRKSIDGLALTVSQSLKGNPLDGSLFVFICRDRSRVKLLYWDKTGFALWYKRLEKNKFIFSRSKLNEDVLNLTPDRLQWLLSGLDIFKMKPHEELKYESVC